MTVLNDDINQLEIFLDEWANKIIQLIITVVALLRVYVIRMRFQRGKF